MKPTIVLLVCICSLPGCTAIFGITGRIIDDCAPDFDTLSTEQIRTLEAEDELSVMKKDGSSERGEFIAIEKATDETYTRAYNEFLLENAGTLHLPRFGDSVFTIASGRFIGPFKFKGFDYDCSWLERSDSSVFPFHGSITFNGQTFSPETGPGDIPLMSSLIVSLDSARIQMPMQSVKHVIVPHRKTGFMSGLIAGAALDAIVVAIAASEGPVFKDLHWPARGE